MGADDIAQAARRRNAVAQRTLAIRRLQQRRFRIGLACAVALHALLFVGVGRWAASPRSLGDPDANPDGISVELVDAADLMSPETVPIPVDNPPVSPPQPQQQPQPEQPPVQAEPVPPPAPVPPQKKTVAIEKAQEQPPVPEPPKKQTKAPPAKTASLQHPQDPLELSLPDAALAPPGHSAAFARPPNITRSGENDEFGRGVVRALRRTMPGSDRLGQVTIRLFLSETGNIVEVRLVRSGGDPLMDQNVLFAAKQASFPIPPAGATTADRTFMVTYVYR